MNFFDYLIKINQWLFFVPSAVGAVTLVIKLWTLFLSIQKYLTIKDIQSGIYNGYWIDPIKKTVNCEILRLTKTLKGIRVIPIYKHKNFHHYKLKINSLLINKFVFKGFWQGTKSTLYKGPAMFHYNEETKSFDGRWLGPKNNGEINGGDWILQFSGAGNNAYFKYLKFKKLYSLKEKIFRKKDIITDIILKHDSFGNDSCKIENITLAIGKESFIPTLGKISIPLIKYVSSVVSANDYVLDLGTGTGFYPTYLAKNVGCHVKGIDINDNIITMAALNAHTNNVTNLTTFDKCLPSELFSGIDSNERFDIIIANLPFTRQENAYGSKNSIHYNSFAGTPELLEQLILGSQYHIKPNGKLIFCYGESGYMELLQSLVNASSWKPLISIKVIKEKDDTFFIFQLELKDKVQSYYKKIDDIQHSIAQ